MNPVELIAFGLVAAAVFTTAAALIVAVVRGGRGGAAAPAVPAAGTALAVSRQPAAPASPVYPPCVPEPPPPDGAMDRVYPHMYSWASDGKGHRWAQNWRDLSVSQALAQHLALNPGTTEMDFYVDHVPVKIWKRSDGDSHLMAERVTERVTTERVTTERVEERLYGRAGVVFDAFVVRCHYRQRHLPIDMSGGATFDRAAGIIQWACADPDLTSAEIWLDGRIVGGWTRLRGICTIDAYGPGSAGRVISERPALTGPQ